VIEDAMQTWYGSRRAQFSRAERAEAEEFIRTELASTVLFDLEVRDIDDQFAVEHLGQPDSNQAAWDEKYLDLTDGKVIGRNLESPPAPSFRLLFYLHFVDRGKPLLTSYGPLPIPRVTSMPDEVWNVAPYRAVD
jgi:hypothetical protein